MCDDAPLEPCTVMEEENQFGAIQSDSRIPILDIMVRKNITMNKFGSLVSNYTYLFTVISIRTLIKCRVFFFIN